MDTHHPSLQAPHAVAAEEVIRTLGTDANEGLTSAAADERRAHHGRNELAQAPRTPWWRRLARQFADLLIWILIAAAVISGVLGEWLDAGAILAIVVLNGLLGFVQEGRAEQALAALQKLSPPPCRFCNRPSPATDLVPGDRIDLEAGDRVPASPNGCHVIQRSRTGTKPNSGRDRAWAQRNQGASNPIRACHNLLSFSRRATSLIFVRSERRKEGASTGIVFAALPQRAVSSETDDDAPELTRKVTRRSEAQRESATAPGNGLLDVTWPADERFSITPWTEFNHSGSKARPLFGERPLF